MVRQFMWTVAALALMLSLPVADSFGRGGRGGFGGGGGGFGGGVSRGGGGFSGGGARPSGFAGGGARPSPGFGGSAGLGGGARPGAGLGVGGSAGFGGGPRPGAGIGGPAAGGVGIGGPAGIGGGVRPGAGIGGPAAGGAGIGGPAGLGGGVRPGAGIGGPAAGRAGPAGLGGGPAIGGLGASGNFGGPNVGQLNSFLGLPSDGGMHGVAASPRTGASQLPAGGGNFDVNRGTAEGPRGGQVGGVTVTGPGGNTAGRAVGVGPNGGVGTVGGVQGAAGGAAARGAAIGPGGQVAAGGAVRGPNGGAAARGVVAGPAGVAGGFARVTPSGRYTTAAAVRTNYNHYGLYGRGWYARYPGAWVATGFVAGAAWNACTWGSAATYCGYSEVPPTYYDYGNNVTYEDNTVYVNGESAGTAQQYYDQASQIAATGAAAEAPSDGDWLPLGVFALCKPEQTTSEVSCQLAVNKEGVVRGNYTDNKTNTNQVIQGGLDKETQKVSFTVGDDKSTVLETGLYNLTKDEAPCLIHFGAETTEQWLLVRLENQDSGAAAQ